MKKGLTRSLALAVVLLMMFGLAACGGATTSPSPTNTSTVTGTSTPGASGQTPRSATLRILVPIMTAEGTSDQDVINAVAQQFSQDTGIDLTLQVTTCDNTAINAAISTGLASNSIDIFSTPVDGSTMSYFMNGAVIPLNSLLDQYGQDLRQQISADQWNAVTINGQIGGIPDYNGAQNSCSMWIDKTLLDQCNLPLPQSMDDIQTDLNAFKQLNPNIIPLGSENPGWFYNCLGGYQIPLQATDSSGKLIPYCYGYAQALYYTTDAFAQWMTYLQNWYTDGLIDQNILTKQSADVDSGWRLGQYGAMLSWYGEASPIVDYLAGNDPANPLPDGQAPQTWVYCTNMTAPSGQPLALSNDGSMNRFVGVTTACQDPDVAVMFLDWMAKSADNMTLCRFGREGTDYTVASDGTFALANVTGQTPEYSGSLGRILPDLFASTLDAKQFSFVTTEWQKAYDPNNKWFLLPDNNVFYTFPNSSVQYDNAQSILATDFQEMLTNQISVTDGIQQLQNDLTNAGWDQCLADMQTQYDAVNGGGSGG